MTDEWIVRNGTVFDGTGAPRRKADVHVRDGRVVAIGANLVAESAKELDATGRWVTPGFFDLDTHYDAEGRGGSGT